MSRLKIPDGKRYTLRLHESDVDFIADAFPTTTPTNVIRTLVSQYVKKMQEKLNERGAKPFDNRAGLDLDTLFKEVHGLD
jgi:hypothetical protein